MLSIIEKRKPKVDIQVFYKINLKPFLRETETGQQKGPKRIIILKTGFSICDPE